MQVSNWIVFGTIEVIAALLLLCGFLLFYTRSLKGLIGKLQAGIKSVVSDLRDSKAQVSQLQALVDSGTQSYNDHVQQQLNATRDYHATLNAGRDITLDLEEGTPPLRQAASFRHAYLLTEKEASSQLEDSQVPNWDILQSKLTTLLSFFRAYDASKNDSASLQKELDQAKQQIANLERFRDLFFELEDKWLEAQQTAEQLEDNYQHSGEDSDFNEFLKRYKDIYNGFGSDLQQASHTLAGGTTQIVTSAPTLSVSSGEDLEELKSLTANQHHLIQELQERLSRAYDHEERDQLIADLESQLDKQLRYMKESETCIKLMEGELDQAHALIDEQQQKIHALRHKVEQNVKLVKATKHLSQERESMLKNLRQLEQENDQLATQLQMLLDAPAAEEPDAGLQDAYDALNQRYLDLENKYLELRTRGRA